MIRSVTFSVFALTLHCTAILAEVRIQQNNGKFYTRILSNGPTSEKYDIVFIGDGFTINDQTIFNNAVNSAVGALQAMRPYSETMCAFNIWRVNVVSTDSGIDHPMQNISRNTELDCRYGNTANGEVERCIKSDSPPKCFEAAAYAPDNDAVFVIVNEPEWGGCHSRGLVFSGIGGSLEEAVTHELGHKIGALADEYGCKVCDGSDSNRAYSGPERPAPNVTINTERATTKWHELIQANTAIPTTGYDLNVVGLFEGGDYFGKGIFRPQVACAMRGPLAQFCAVCAETLREELRGKWCNLCELNPGSYWCSLGDLLARWRLVYSNPRRIRFPIPVCLHCPSPQHGELGDEVVLTLTGVPADFRLQAVDDYGKVVAQGRRERDGLQIRFTADPAIRYSFDLISGDAPTQAVINIGASLTRNGKLQQLPSIGRQ